MSAAGAFSFTWSSDLLFSCGASGVSLSSTGVFSSFWSSVLLSSSSFSRKPTAPLSFCMTSSCVYTVLPSTNVLTRGFSSSFFWDFFLLFFLLFSSFSLITCSPLENIATVSGSSLSPTAFITCLAHSMNSSRFSSSACCSDFFSFSGSISFVVDL